jgi:hypothetical protein
MMLCRGVEADLSGRDSGVRVEPAENLCDLVVFMEEASGAILSAGAEGVEADDVVWAWLQRRGLTYGLVWAMPVVEALVFAEEPHQVSEVPYERAVGEFGAEAAEPVPRQNGRMAVDLPVCVIG